MTTCAEALTEIRLVGELGARFGRVHRLVVHSPAEAVRALGILRPGFTQYLLDHSEPGYTVKVASRARSEESLTLPSRGRRIVISPVVHGGKSGLGQIIAGVALIAAVYFTGGMAGAGFSMVGTSWLSTVAINVGLAMALGGVSQLLAQPPGLDAPRERPENQPSYAFDGVVNTWAQGQCVPVLYGELEVGGAVISAEIDVGDMDRAYSSRLAFVGGTTQISLPAGGGVAVAAITDGLQVRAAVGMGTLEAPTLGPVGMRLVRLTTAAGSIVVSSTSEIKAAQGYVEADQIKAGDVLWNGVVVTATDNATDTCWSIRWQSAGGGAVVTTSGLAIRLDAPPRKRDIPTE